MFMRTELIQKTSRPVLYNLKGGFSREKIILLLVKPDLLLSVCADDFHALSFCKKMKKLILVFGIAIIGLPAMAQISTAPLKQANAKTAAPTKQSPELRAKFYTNELKTKLALTDDQYGKVLTVNTECIRRKDAVKAGGGKANGGYKAISAYRKEQFSTILTPEQMSKLQAMNDQYKNKKKGGADAE